jgi:SpoOM protein
MGFLGFGGNASIQLLLDREDVAAGGTLQATVRVAGGKKDLTIDAGRLRLVRENEYEWRERTTSFSSSSSSSTSSTSTRRDTDRKIVEEQRFLEAGAVAADTPSEHMLTLEIPAGSAPSAEGKITRVRWKVQATLARPRARDISDEVRVEVLSTEVGWEAPAEEVESHGECELAFRLEKRAFGAGEPIEGTVVLTPSAECTVNEVRVELEREEKVPRGEGNEERVREAQAILAGEVELSPGAPVEYPFRLEVPPDPVATLWTEHSMVRWQLKGTGSRRMRRDYNVVQAVLIYSAPPAHVAL